MKKLIVTADDFGLSLPVNEAVDLARARIAHQLEQELGQAVDRTGRRHVHCFCCRHADADLLDHLRRARLA